MSLDNPDASFDFALTLKMPLALRHFARPGIGLTDAFVPIGVYGGPARSRTVTYLTARVRDWPDNRGRWWSQA